jgi:hypothetical protein
MKIPLQVSGLGVFLPDIIALQFLAKLAGGFMWSLAAVKFQHKLS